MKRSIFLCGFVVLSAVLAFTACGNTGSSAPTPTHFTEPDVTVAPSPVPEPTATVSPTPTPEPTPKIAVLDSGTCGKSLTWAFGEDGTLTISGKGIGKYEGE